MKTILLVAMVLLSSCARGPSWVDIRTEELNTARSGGKITEKEYLELKIQLDQAVQMKKANAINNYRAHFKPVE